VIAFFKKSQSLLKLTNWRTIYQEVILLDTIPFVSKYIRCPIELDIVHPYIGWETSPGFLRQIRLSRTMSQIWDCSE
jgi:hypothetical protein